MIGWQYTTKLAPSSAKQLSSFQNMSYFPERQLEATEAAKPRGKSTGDALYKTTLW
jgi:hypothetical protein